MTLELSKGALATIMQGGDYNSPVVQVLSIKKMNTGSGQDRYRAFLSDGQHSVSFAMLTAQVYAKAGPKGLNKFCVIKITRHITSLVNNTGGKDSRVLLILDLELLNDGDEVGMKIGDPVPFDEKTVNGNKQDMSSSRSSLDSAPAAKVRKLDNGATPGSSNGGANVTLSNPITSPISSLSPYNNKWIIRARVLTKSDIKKWSNSKGEGQLFSFDLADETGEIRCTAFRDAVDQFYDRIEVDKVYYFSRCQVKMANKSFNTLNNDYELTLAKESVVQECHDADLSSLQTQYKFVEINKIADVEPNQTIDVIGVVKSTGDVVTFQAKTTGRELKKREVQLVDESNTAITLTLWGSQAENFDGSNNPVVVLKGVKVSEFGGGKTVSCLSSTMMRLNPEMTECYRLKGWYQSEGMHASANDISARSGISGTFNTPWLCFKQVTDQQLGSINQEKGDYYQAKATVLLVRSENCIYKACPTEECNKKVVDNNDGTYNCEKCRKVFDKFKYRLLCSMNIGDWSGNQWVSMFSSEAEKVLGMSAEEAGQLMENDNAAFLELIEKANFKEFIFKCRAKMETYNDEQRLKTVAVRVDPINHDEYNSHLISNIKQLIST